MLKLWLVCYRVVFRSDPWLASILSAAVLVAIGVGVVLSSRRPAWSPQSAGNQTPHPAEGSPPKTGVPTAATSNSKTSSTTVDQSPPHDSNVKYDPAQLAWEKSVSLARQFLATQQAKDGSWSLGAAEGHVVGATSLAVLALLNAGLTIDDLPVKNGLKYLRSVKEPEPKMTYEISLMASALAAAKDGRRDKARLLALAQKLEKSQVKDGENSGSWSYNASELLGGFADRSNSHFAVLGLRDAADAGIPVDRAVWERARDHWLKTQYADGSWSYSDKSVAFGTGSMTSAGLTVLLITESMLADDRKVDVRSKPIRAATDWLSRNFAVDRHPGAADKTWHFYYLNALSRTGKISGISSFGIHDWRQEGTTYLVGKQDPTRGFWKGESSLERDEVLATCCAMLYLTRAGMPTTGTATNPPQQPDSNAKSITSASTGMKLLLIPASEYVRGSPDSDKDAQDDEKPAHKVKITRAFYLGQHEVTQGEWKAVMGAEPWKGMTYVMEGTKYPATHVSHGEAVEFCRKLSQLDGRTYLLPTEAEWEYAARGGATTRFSFGDDESKLGEYAWYDRNALDIGELHAHQVGLKQPNGFGMFDMHGNVWEWCADWYDEKEYAQYARQVAEDPKGPSAAASQRVMRGGGWNDAQGNCRSADRGRSSPGYRDDALGFRILAIPSVR